MKKVAMFVFNGDPMCFIHVLLNALDFKARGSEALIIIEGSATKLIPDLALPENPLHSLWNKAREAGLVHGICRACAGKMKTLEDAESQGIQVLDEMNGHPGMAAFCEKGYEIITF